MPRKTTQKLTVKEIEKLLNQQTIVILSAVDEKLKKMELRIDKKIDKLTNIIDNFLKRFTDTEDEFTVIKADLKRIKTVLKEKLGVVLD